MTTNEELARAALKRLAIFMGIKWGTIYVITRAARRAAKKMEQSS